MLTVISIIGQPNVGKSTLFNRLTNSKAALVFNFPGTTRDRNYGFAEIENNNYILIDTGGITSERSDDQLISNQVDKAINESQVILFLVDAHLGLTMQDINLAKKLRKSNKKVLLLINKIDGVNLDIARIDFFKLGFHDCLEISAKSNRGINNLKAILLTFINKQFSSLPNNININNNSSIKVAIVGQPNVGKSTLINNILGEDRVIVLDSPGTTRDSIYIPAKLGKQQYVLIDTAGVRRKSKVKDTLEKFSVIKTLQAINDSQVALLLIDAYKGLVEQDLKLIESIISSGKSLVLAVNKWDLIPKIEQPKLLKKIKQSIEFVNFIKPITISGLHGVGIKKIFQAILNAFKSATQDVPTNKLTLLLEQAIVSHQPPLSKGRRIKLRYAHLGGHFPFRVIIHGNQVNNLPLHYKKYLSNFYREKLKLEGTSVDIITKKSDNPYV